MKTKSPRMSARDAYRNRRSRRLALLTAKSVQIREWSLSKFWGRTCQLLLFARLGETIERSIAE